MKNQEAYIKLIDIICDILDIKNDMLVTAYSFLPTKYNKEYNSINIYVDKEIGILDLFLNIGHETFHAKQHRANMLIIDMQEYQERFIKYKDDQWMMYYYYTLEREAHAFGWLLAGCANDILYKNHDNQEFYEQGKNIYKSMMKLWLSDTRLHTYREETQKWLDEEFEKMSGHYKEKILSKANDFVSWKNTYASPRQ